MLILFKSSSKFRILFKFIETVVTKQGGFWDKLIYFLLTLYSESEYWKVIGDSPIYTKNSD